jgi:hypothetical protein
MTADASRGDPRIETELKVGSTPSQYRAGVTAQQTASRRTLARVRGAAHFWRWRNGGHPHRSGAPLHSLVGDWLGLVVATGKEEKKMTQSNKRARTCVGLLVLAITLGAPIRAQAGMITVVGDVSAQNNFSFFDAVLGNQSSVVFSRGAVQQPTLRTHWDQLPGVTAIESSAVLTTSFLSTVDLLVVTNNFSEPLDYTPSEIGAVGQFVDAGGAVLMIAEFNTIFWDPNIYNDFLIGIGSSIRFNDVRTNTLEAVSPEDTPLTAGLDDFNTSAYNTLTGGIAGYIGSAGTFIAYEGAVVPEPSTALLVATGLVVLARRRSRADRDGRFQFAHRRSDRGDN